MSTETSPPTGAARPQAPRPRSVAYRVKNVVLGPPLKTSQVTDERIRKRVADLESDGHRRVVAINRNGSARIVHADLLLQDGDQLHLAVDAPGLDELRPMIMAARRAGQAGDEAVGAHR